MRQDTRKQSSKGLGHQSLHLRDPRNDFEFELL
jgi:hypothetical protein